MSAKQKHVCPGCGGDGGVLMLNRVDPCDECRSGKRSGRFRVTQFIWQGRKSVPDGALGWTPCHDLSSAERYIRDIQSSIDAGNKIASIGMNGRISFGITLFAPPDQDDIPHFKGKPALALMPGSASAARPPRVVGSIPDPWHGSSAKFRWSEGHPIRMVLQAGDVPVVSVLHTWMEYPMASAHDCGFKDMPESLRMQLRRHGEWHQSLPAKDRDAAEGLLKRDRVLLVVD